MIAEDREPYHYDLFTASERKATVGGRSYRRLKSVTSLFYANQDAYHLVLVDFFTGCGYFSTNCPPHAATTAPVVLLRIHCKIERDVAGASFSCRSADGAGRLFF